MWLEYFPQFVIENLSVFGLIVVGLLVEKRFVSRPSIFANAIAINVYVNKQAFPPEWLILYANIALIAGIVAISAYASNTSLGGYFYDIMFLSYSSLSVGGVILITVI